MTTHAIVSNGLDIDTLVQTIQAIQEKPELAKCKFYAHNKWVGGSHNTTEISHFYGALQDNPHSQTFQLNADEPPILGGDDQDANPVEHLLHALAGCMTTSLVAHAAVRGIHIDEVESELDGDMDMRGFLGLDESIPNGYQNIRIKFTVTSDEKDLERLKELAETSPVLNTLLHGVAVDVQLNSK